MLSSVYRLTHNGWPATSRQIPGILHKYWDMDDELTSDDGLLLKGSRAIISLALSESFLHELHEECTGIMKSQITARTLTYWSSINNEIKDNIK